VPTLVTNGGRFEQFAEHEYRIDAESADDYSRIWSKIASPSQHDIRVVYLWGLDSPSFDGDQRAEVSDGVSPLEALLHLSRVVSNGGRTKPTLWCVTRNAVGIDTTSSGSLSVEQAPLWGFGRTAALEHPDVWGGLVDLGSDASTAELRALINEVVADSPEDQVALRGSERYVARLERGETPNVAPLVLAPDASYLVTGGGGALGAHVARWLIARGARHLVLASRRGDADLQARSVAQDLEALGAKVTVVAADVSRAESVDTLMTVISGSGHALRGVVHAAGIDVVTPIRELSAEGLRAVLAPKVTGGWLLHERTRSLSLDFFVCFSSVASVLGSNGRAHYGAANAFLDSLAQKRRQLGLPALSVNWGPWRGGGMATDEHLVSYERLGNHGLDPDAALSSIDRVLGGDQGNYMIADIDWDRFRPVYEARRQHPLVADLKSSVSESAAASAASDGALDSRGAPGSGPDWVVRLAAAEHTERQSTLELLLRKEVAELLGFESIDDVLPDSNFYQLGMDSLMTAELVGRLRTRVGMPCTGLVLDHPNVKALAPRLLEALQPTLATARPGSAAAPHAAPSAPGTPLQSSERSRNGFSDYAPDDDARVVEFQTQAFPDRKAEWILPRWRWMFIDAARRLGREPLTWLYRDEDRIVGQMGAIPVRLKIGKGHRDTAWLVDTMVLESHRALAIGSRMMLQSHEDLPFSLSLGQSPEMREIQERLGWKQIAPLLVAQLLIRPENVLKRKLGTPGAWAAGLGLRATAALRDVFRDRARVDIREVGRFDGRHDALWNAMARDVTCGVVRDASFLNWKYVDQPGQEFVRLELIEGGHVQGVVVLSLREPDAAYGYKRAFLVDIVGPLRDETLLQRLIAVAADAAEKRGADSLVCMHTHAALTHALKANGFHLRKPTRYLLVDVEGLSAPELELVLAPGNWHLTQGDSDIDRPGVS
jgi:acyl carrier protein